MLYFHWGTTITLNSKGMLSDPVKPLCIKKKSKVAGEGQGSFSALRVTFIAGDKLVKLTSHLVMEVSRMKH